MTADVELLPCGECGMPCRPGEYHPYAACLMFKTCRNSDTVRGNLQDAQDHATAAKDAEIEALRAEVERLQSDTSFATAISSLRREKERAERLAEALREIANQGPHYGPDGTYKTWRHWAEIARAALEQEEGRG